MSCDHQNLSNFTIKLITASAERTGDAGVESYKVVQKLARWRGEEEYSSIGTLVAGDTWQSWPDSLTKLFNREGN